MTQVPTADPATPTARADDESIVKCAGLTKVFKDFWMRNRVRAVDAIDLDIHQGEVFGLLGPNGSGKSTTIKLILGLLKPTAGRVFVYGRRPDDVATKKQIGYLPEESYLYRFLNARETLDYYGRLFGQGRAQRRRRIDMLLEMVGLEAVQRRPVGEYSKGMQRRIGLAQALINDPRLLILDEPTTGLDPIGTRQIKDLIGELAERGKTVLLCSHLLGDVEDVCDRVAIMFGGRVRQSGTVRELLVEQGLTSIETDELDDPTVAEIEQLLEKHGKHIRRTDRPRRTLESLFLDIVEQAQAEGVHTAGARAGGAIASFLTDVEDRSAHMPADMEAEEVIDRLVTGSEPSSVPDAEPADEPEAGGPEDTSPGSDVVNRLVSGDSSGRDEPAEAPADDSPAPEPADEGVDESVIDSLIDRRDRDEGS